MKNTDVKIIASATNRQLMPLMKEISPIQRGLVTGRQLLGDIVDVDTCSRKCSTRPGALQP
eukprot:327713-Pyramimonas_sp.AAC.1